MIDRMITIYLFCLIMSENQKEREAKLRVDWLIWFHLYRLAKSSFIDFR